MAPRKIRTLDEAHDDLAYTQIALSLDPLTRDLEGTVDPLLNRWEEVGRERRLSLREVLRAQAIYGDVNFRADAAVNDLAWDVERATGGTRNARYSRYFPLPPSRLVRRALGAMATRMLGWVEGLKTEPEPEVSRHAVPIESLAKESMAAVEGLSVAYGNRATTRSRVVDDYLDEVNSFRLDLQGELQKRAVADPKRRLGPEWVAKFFKPATRRASGSPDEPESPPAPPA